MDLARRLRTGQLPLGDAFTFMSGLYFRGKLAYAQAFGRAEPNCPTSLVITPTRGLVSPDVKVSVDILLEFGGVDVNAGNARFTRPLERDASILARRLPPNARVVLLGSIATGKYVDVLAPIFEDCLYYPVSFIGRGDMSRGGLLLRSMRSGVELEYEPIGAGVRPKGKRPPRLQRLW